ncbi:MAG: hypothetical protein NVSMB18_19130 [Acetobacteraceae bacterium]
MTYASAVLPLFPVTTLPCPRRILRTAAQILAGAAQVIGFATVLWILAAGPGALTDTASTVPHRTVR